MELRYIFYQSAEIKLSSLRFGAGAICVCVYICMYIYVHTHTHICAYTCVYTYVYKYVGGQNRICTYEIPRA